jgi:hypothetical protein
MGDVVSDGDSFSCPFCTDKVKLGVSSSPIESDSKKLATTSNHSFSAPGAQCIVVPSAPKPCQPNAQNIVPGQSPLAIEGSSALGAGCKFMCANGGLLAVSSSSQSSTVHDGAAGAEAAAALAASSIPSPPPIDPKEEKADDEDSNPPPEKKKEKFKKGNRDGRSPKQRNKENKQRDGTPGNNQMQNDDFDAAVKQIENKTGKNLTKKDKRRLHNHITKENYDYHGIVDEGMTMFGDN